MIDASITSELDAFVTDARQFEAAVWSQAADLPRGKALLSVGADQKLPLVFLVIDRLAQLKTISEARVSTTNERWRAAQMLNSLLGGLLRSSLVFDSAGIQRLLDFVAGQSQWMWVRPPVAAVVSAVERFAQAQSLSEGHVAALQKLTRTSALQGNLRDARKLRDRVDALLNGPAEAAPVSLDPGDVWADRATADLAGMDAPARGAWAALLQHARSASASKPSNAWVKECRKRIGDVGAVPFARAIREWFPLVGLPGAGREFQGVMGPVRELTMMSEPNADVLKGLAWAAGASGDATLARTVADLAEVCFKKIPQLGARCVRVGNACLVALNLLPGNDPVGELTRLRSRVKQPSVRAAVEKAVDRSAAALGVSRDEVEEMSTPTFGLDAGGKLAKSFGSITAELAIVGTCEVALTWRGAGGKTVKSVPGEVKREHAAELKSLQRVQKDLQKTLPAQAQRIERLLVERREWPLDVWRARYLDHPLLAHVSRRLIWEVVGAPARTVIWRDGALVMRDDVRVEPPADARVRLWHPADAPPQVVLEWRSWLETHEVTQPFKQAHREIYLLTDAERQTVTYSNRFAAHVLRQHQFNALCQARGWRYRLMGGFDSHNTPTLELPRHDLRVEYWVEQPPNDELSPAGINLRIVTDQVRFCRRGDPHPMPLERVDPLVFSECMRDVDLFVGVASVGNDPNWRDGGPEGRFQNYWQEFSFGKLSETAQTRRGVLETLLPRLTKIRARCSLTDRFLVVRGDLRTYKIHLGSGNILMEPNDQYLCIVPSRSTTGAGDTPFLPFEGDATLSIVLSKAFMLADDKAIADVTITRQIGRG